MSDNLLHIFGVSGDALPQATADFTCIVASERLAARLRASGSRAEIIPIIPLASALELIEERLKNGEVAVLASGDPLFCGIGRTLLARFGAERLRIAPGISSLQLLAARCGMPWDDLPWVTLHGRPATPEAEAGVPAMLLGQRRVAILTDRHYTPARIAALLLAYLDLLADNFNDGEKGEDLPAEVLPFAVASLAAGWQMTVGQRLGEADEELFRGDLAAVAALSFAEPNIVLLKIPAEPTAEFFPLGLTAAEISHRGGLITKDEARAVAHEFWTNINEPNLVENIRPTRARASLVLRKESDHRVQKVLLRKL